MTEMCSSLRRTARLSAIVLFAAVVLNASAASAQPTLGSAASFAVLGGPAVTCTDNTPANTITDVIGDVGVLLSTGFTNTGCTIVGTVHAGDGAAGLAYADFLKAYNKLAVLNNNPQTCDSFHRLAGTLSGLVLTPGTYCVDDVAKAGLLTLDAQRDKRAVWIFLVDGVADHALTGTNFKVVMINGGEPCNVYWWVKAAATMTTSNFLGTILAGAAITVSGGTIDGRAFATAAVTLTNPKITACTSGSATPPPMDKCEDHHDHDGDDNDHDKDDHDHDKDGHDHDKDHDHGKDNDHGKDKKR